VKIPFDFNDKTVFIMGGTSGINLGIAKGFAENGASVAVASRSQEKVDAAITELSKSGAEITGFASDVRDVETLQAGLEMIAEKFGHIDILIAGQAGNFPAKALAMSSNGFKSVMDIDLQGTFNVLRHSYQYLTKPGASIINISAPQAFVPMELQVHVCAAKAGVDMITRVLALEWGAAGIRVNSIVPGPVAGTVGMERLAPTPELESACTDSVPLGRWGTTEDIANCAMFLSSPYADYINGAVIPVDGGWSLGGAPIMSKHMIKENSKNS